MKSKKINLMSVLISALLMTMTVHARPTPDSAADYAEKQAAWEKHQQLVAS